MGERTYDLDKVIKSLATKSKLTGHEFDISEKLRERYEAKPNDNLVYAPAYIFGWTQGEHFECNQLAPSIDNSVLAEVGVADLYEDFCLSSSTRVEVTWKYLHDDMLMSGSDMIAQAVRNSLAMQVIGYDYNRPAPRDWPTDNLPAALPYSLQEEPLVRNGVEISAHPCIDGYLNENTRKYYVVFRMRYAHKADIIRVVSSKWYPMNPRFDRFAGGESRDKPVGTIEGLLEWYSKEDLIATILECGSRQNKGGSR